jgi:integrase
MRERLDIHGYDRQLERVWVQIHTELPHDLKLYQKYDELLITQALSKTHRVNNLKALLSLGRIMGEKNFKWKSITSDQVTSIVAYVMTRWADDQGKETHHTSGHKKFLIQFVRWLKTGRRLWNKKVQEPVEIIDIDVKKVKQKLTREDMLTPEEKEDLLDACGDNLRDKAFIAVIDDAGARAGEALNTRIGHLVFGDNGTASIHVDGKTGEHDIQLYLAVPYLVEWVNNHPKRSDKTAPLWLNNKGNHMNYASARAMIKRRQDKVVKLKGGATTLQGKRIFITLFRHTEITRAAKWMAPQLMKLRHGWSKGSEMLENYEHLVNDDASKAYLEHYGLQPPQEEKENAMPVFCRTCNKLNIPTNNVCGQCNTPVNLQGAMSAAEDEKQRNRKYIDDEIAKGIEVVKQQVIQQLIKNPELTR